MAWTAAARIASSLIDVSDGLLADLAHICRASGVGAEVDIERCWPAMPFGTAFDPDTRHVLQAARGDDYELNTTAHPRDAQRCNGCRPRWRYRWRTSSRVPAPSADGVAAGSWWLPASPQFTAAAACPD